MDGFDTKEILSMIQTVSVVIAVIAIIWKGGKWTGTIDTKLTEVSSEICAMRKDNEKQWDTMRDHSEDIARMQGRINGFAACSNFMGGKAKL